MEFKSGAVEGMAAMISKILILGAGGFMGRNLKEFLEKKKDLYEIYAPCK